MVAFCTRQMYTWYGLDWFGFRSPDVETSRLYSTLKPPHGRWLEVLSLSLNCNIHILTNSWLLLTYSCDVPCNIHILRVCELFELEVGVSYQSMYSGIYSSNCSCSAQGCFAQMLARYLWMHEINAHNINDDTKGYQNSNTNMVLIFVCGFH